MLHTKILAFFEVFWRFYMVKISSLDFENNQNNNKNIKNNMVKKNNKRGGKKKKSEIIFDEAKRRDFLTGFRKRKQERRQKAKDEHEIKLKEEIRLAK